MKKIKIMHIAQAAGGVDRYIRVLLKYLNSDKYENILICSNDYDLNSYINLVDKFEQIEMTRNIDIKDLFVTREIRKIILKHKPDIIYAHSSKAGALARMANIGTKIKCIYNPHGWSFNMQCASKKKMIYTIIERIAALFCDKIICISDAEYKSALNKKICNKRKLKTIYNGIDIDEYEDSGEKKLSRNDLGIPENALVFGMVGRLSLQKAPDTFIKSAKLIKQRFKNAFFIIVGNGPMEEEILSLAKSYDIDKSLIITGWINNPLDYVALFDVAFLLSRWEGFGLALAEYMLKEKPIIATNIDAIPNLIFDHYNGILVDVDDENMVFNATVEIMENDKLRQNLIKNGKDSVYDRFNAKRMAIEHEELIDELML